MTFLPLQGIRVVDVTTSLAGPYCTEVLGALGADVVKIEPPGTGDEARTWGPPFQDGESTLFLAMNANKRSVGLNLRHGHDVLLRLVERADVFVQSLRPGLAEERGLGPDALLELNPRLVYCSINAFGRSGPWSNRPGYDPLMQAAGGILSVTGEPGRPGVRVGVSIIDQGTGTWAALGILASLMERQQTGRGGVVDVALYETAVSLLSYQIAGYLASGELPGRWGTGFASISPYQVFRTSDGELMIAAGNDRLFAALAEAVGTPELATDPRFLTNADRVRHREALSELLAEQVAVASSTVWLERLGRAGVPVAPVQNVGEVVAHEQTQASGILQQMPEGMTMVAMPLLLDGERVLHRTPAPELGAHTAEVLAEAGYSEQEIDELAARGAISLPSDR
jgi:crotonobetainyl-CoA:carnitine CoA-transferase CaiB-like acyl-CoA transferase